MSGESYTRGLGVVKRARTRPSGGPWPSLVGPQRGRRRKDALGAATHHAGQPQAVGQAVEQSGGRRLWRLSLGALAASPGPWTAPCRQG